MTDHASPIPPQSLTPFTIAASPLDFCLLLFIGDDIVMGIDGVFFITLTCVDTFVTVAN